jgi:hypothetical protein
MLCIPVTYFASNLPGLHKSFGSVLVAEKGCGGQGHGWQSWSTAGMGGDGIRWRVVQSWERQDEIVHEKERCDGRGDWRVRHRRREKEGSEGKDTCAATTIVLPWVPLLLVILWSSGEKRQVDT